MKSFRSAIRIQTGPRKQKGVTLIVALIFLGVLTLLGVTAAQVTGQEERMSGNARNRDLAFQAAEAALQAAEKSLSTLPGTFPAATVETPGGSGMYTFALCMPNSQAFWAGSGDKDCANASKSAFDWGATNAAIALTGVAGVASQPQYIVEKMPNLAGAKRYRVTARGVGGEASAVVILQAVYTTP